MKNIKMTHKQRSRTFLFTSLRSAQHAKAKRSDVRADRTVVSSGWSRYRSDHMHESKKVTSYLLHKSRRKKQPASVGKLRPSLKNDPRFKTNLTNVQKPQSLVAAWQRPRGQKKAVGVATGKPGPFNFKGRRTAVSVRLCKLAPKRVRQSLNANQHYKHG